MEFFIIYFIKVNVALAILYFFYKLSFTKDTFFGLRRLMLILIYITAFIYPLFDFSTWMTLDNNMAGQAVNILHEKVLPEIIIFSKASGELSIYSRIGMTLIGAYIIGVVILLIRTFLELLKIGRILHNSEKIMIEGIRICVADKGQEPYSFFRWICMYPDLCNDKETKEILAHEHTHVREIHSADIMLAQLIIILCWFNPFSWLIRSEIRINHEYLADRKVVATGYDKKAYQYHLLGLKHAPLAIANLYNNFNVLPLKNRIKMLNRKRTRNIMKSKYLMFIPVATLLVLFSNCANTATEEPVKPVVEKLEVPGEFIAIKVTPEEHVYDVAEQMPEYPGGNQELMSYLVKNIKYPAEAEKNAIQGRVIVQFVVNTDGSIVDTKIIRGVDADLDKEALRVVNEMPKWKPGTQDGKVIRVKYTVPIAFKLK